VLLLLMKKVDLCQIQDFVAMAAKDCLQREQAEAFICSRVMVSGIEVPDGSRVFSLASE